MAYDFDGTEGLDNNQGGVPGNVPVLIGGWFNKDDTTLDGAVIALSGRATAHRFGVFPWSDATILAVHQATSYNDIASAGTYSAGVWHHAAGFFEDASNRHVYLDGTKTSDTPADSGAATLDEVQIAYNNTNLGDINQINGRVGECFVYQNASLTETIADSIVLQLAAGFSPLLVYPSFLTNYWPLVRHKNDIVGGAAFAMTDVGTPTVAAHPRVFMPSPRTTVTAPAAVGGFQAAWTIGSNVILGAGAPA